MKKYFIFSFFLASGVFFLEPSISKEIVEDKNLIEKVSFDIWWEDKYNESVITLRTYPEDIKTIQIHAHSSPAEILRQIRNKKASWETL